MKVYQYNNKGYYIDILNLDESDKSPSGRWNIPAKCTEIKPPAEKEGYKRKWTGIAWEYEEIPKESEPQEPTFDELKSIKLMEVKNDYLKALYAVAWVEQDGNLYGYDTDPGSQLDFSMSHARAKLNGATYYNVYTDKSNLETKEFLEHTPEMFDKVLTEVGNLQEGIYTKYYAVKALVKAAKTPEELEGISFDMEAVDGQ